jgi:hypothetical protein
MTGVDLAKGKVPNVSAQSDAEFFWSPHLFRLQRPQQNARTVQPDDADGFRILQDGAVRKSVSIRTET